MSGDTGGTNHAARWTTSTGIQSIQDTLTAHGVNLAGWTLLDAWSVSAEGTVITGVGLDPSGHFQSWIVHIPVNAFALLDLHGVDHSIGSLVWGGTVTNSGPNSATLTAGSDNTNTTFNGVIQDGTSTTALTKVGTGTLTLTGANTYSGGTNINGGALAVSTNDKLGNASGGLTFDGGTLQYLSSFDMARMIALNAGGGTFDTNGYSSALSGNISSGGDLTKVGTGTLTLSGTKTYTGATAVNAGALSVTGDISSSSGVTVNNGGTLSGTGSVPTTTIISGGTLAPGTSVANGTLTVNGSLTFNSGSTYSVNVSSTSADKTVVQGAPGTTTINGGTLAITVQPGGARSYSILSSLGPITGTFPTLNVTGTVRNPSVTYGINNIVFSVDQSFLSPTLPSSSSSNQRGVSNGTDNAISNGATLSNAFNALFGLTGSALTNALTQVSGEAGSGGGRQGATHMMGSFLTLALNPFGGSSGGNIGGVGGGRGFGFAAEQELPPEAAQAYAAVTPKDHRAASTLDRRWGVWGQVYGGYNTTSGDTSTGTHDTTSRSYGLATGADYRASPDLMLGFALAGGGTNYGLSDGLGGGKSDVFQIGFYGSKQFGPAYISAALSYAWHGMKTDRTVTISGTDILTARFNAHSFGGRVESGYRFDVPFVSITPYAALQMQQFRTPSYSETATSGSGAFALTYDAKSTTSTRTELGVWLDKMIALDRGNALAIRTRAAWAHDHSSDGSVSAAFQTLPGSSFTTTGAGAVPNSALLSAGAEIRLASGMSFGAKFDGEFARRSQTYAGTGTVRYVW